MKAEHMPTLKEILNRGDLIRADELAAGMKVSQGTVYQWVRRGLIPFLQIGKCVRFEPAEVEAWLKTKHINAVKLPSGQDLRASDSLSSDI